MMTTRRTRSTRSTRPIRPFFVTIVSLLFAVGSGSPVIAQKELVRTDLIQPFLGDEHAQWLLGPVAHIATEEEIREFQTLDDDGAAEVFIQGFWAVRGDEMYETFLKRSAHADDEYTEGHVHGSRTDRGTVYILYGAPSSTEYEEFRDVSEPEVELWKYAKKAPKGLNGKKPARSYRFARRGQLTRLYRPPSADELQRRARLRAP